MTDVVIAYENIVWPSKYVHKARERASHFPDDQKALKTLYQFTFDKHRMLKGCAPIEVPFSRGLDMTQHAVPLAEETPLLPLSIVTITRNDNHVERMRERTQAFIDSIYLLAERHKTPVELIIVEWNPPGNTPPLKDAFKFTRNHPFVSTLIVRVPEEVHQQYRLADSLPLYQMIGKNVGIRRARGRYILATNIDVLLSDELFQFITGPKMQPGKLYRSNRWDIDRKVLDLPAPADMLAQARSLCFQINYADGIREVGQPAPITHRKDDLAHDLAISHLHTWACGDFQLAHREDWAKIAGYCELDAYSFHIDSLFSITCHYAGLEEELLPDDCPHFHIDHTLGTPIKSNTYVINEKKALYHISYMTLLQCDYQMKQAGDYFVFNDEFWGLANYNLPREHVTKADWETQLPQYKTMHRERNGFSCYQSPAYFEEQERHYQTRYLKTFQAFCQQTAKFLKTYHTAKDIFIWGAGERGKTHAKELLAHDVPIKGFIHGTETDVSDRLLGIPVIRGKDFPINDARFILVASIFAEEIRSILEKKGAEEGRHYMVLS